MATICQKSRTSLDAHEKGPSENGKDTPNQYVGQLSESGDLPPGLEALSELASLLPRRHRL